MSAMNKFYYLILVPFLFLFSGCAEDILIPEESTDGNISPGDPYTLTFTVGVPPMGTDNENKNTRAIFYGNPLYYEDWIDTQNGFRVLFFLSKREKTGQHAIDGLYEDDNNFVAADPVNPLKDYFLFESTSRWVTQLPYDDDNNLRYRITVPLYQIGNEDSEYKDSWEKIRNLLRKYDFKVAVLANHPSSFTWTIENSVLSAPDIDDLSVGTSKLMTVNDIHHTVTDGNYTSNTERLTGYQTILGNDNMINGKPSMGPFINWVTMRSELYGDALGGNFSSQETARDWIRDYWRPELKYNEDNDKDIEYEPLYRYYRHIWSYWNFGGAASDNALPYTDKSKINSHLNAWEERNGALIRNYITDAAANGGSFSSDLNTSPSDGKKYDGSLPLKFYPSQSKALVSTSSNGKRLYGITIPKLSANPTSTSAKDVFHFKARAHGTVYVRYSSNNGSVYVMSNGSKINPTSTTTKTVNGVKIIESGYYFLVSGATSNVMVFSLNGESTIYDIEFVQDQYMYYTDREGVLPSHDHPIPMYGIQKYRKLEGFWEEGTSFDLTEGGSDEDGSVYPAKTLALLRAVAKIELKIPKSLGVPKHAYMRSLNRFVRCEPTDVSTPTNELWKNHETECEWIDIQKHGPFYNDGSINSNDYIKKLTWYYGSWAEWGWNYNGKTSFIPSQSEGPFPRIMNPYIMRSDFAAFIDVTEYYNDQYYHLLFYMGENPVDAPNNYSGAQSGAKIPHIELRFDDRYASTSRITPNTDINLEDDDCYRIYFTPGGIAPEARDANGVSIIPKDAYESKYENKTAYLKQHWPILRNHVYSFTVTDVGGDAMNGIVVDAQNRSVDFNFK